MKKIIFLVIIVSVINSSQAQTFEWAKGFIGNSYANGHSVKTDAAGNVFTTGIFSDSIDFDPGPGVFKLYQGPMTSTYVSKLDANGNFVWARRIGGYNSTSLNIDAAGNVYITGNFYFTQDFDPGPAVFNLVSAGDKDIFICKLDNNGNFIWAKNMGGADEEVSYAITVDASGNVFTTGYFSDTADFDPGPGVFSMVPLGSISMFVSKLDASGNFVWAILFGNNYPTQYGSAIDVDTSGNIYLTGLCQGIVDFDPGPAVYNLDGGGGNVYVLKLTTNANLVWARNMTGSGSVGYGIDVDGSGNVHTTGFFASTVDFDPGPGVYNLVSGANQSIFVSKLNSSGDFVWAKSMNGPVIDIGYSIVVGPSGNVYTTGDFEGTTDFDPGPGVYNLTSDSTYSDIFVSCLDSSGNFEWAAHMGGNSYDNGSSITLDGAGNIYTTGTFKDTADFDPGPLNYFLNSIYIYHSAFVHKIGSCNSVNNPVYADFCDSTIINGISYTNSATFTDYHLNMNGCDSNIIYHLTKHNTTYNFPTITACDSFILGNQTYFTSGVYTQQLVSPWGCDSFVTANLTIKHSSTHSITATTCNSFTLNGQTYVNTGTYTQTLVNAQGCDSVITLNLTINNSSYTTLNVDTCISYTLNGQTYTASGVYTQTYTNVVGCDSIVTLNLTIHQPTASIINQSACLTYTLNGQTYTTTGTYTQTLLNAAGCDSVITLNLIINQPSAHTIAQTACNSCTINGQTYTASGTYTQTLMNAAGCDSVLTINLTINNSTTNTITASSCTPYILNGQTYNTTGVYTQTFINAAGCDSVLTLNLTINTVNTGVTQTGATLVSNAVAATYQWLLCNPFQNIVGETNQTFVAVSNGAYAVAVTENGCTDTSICYTVNGVGTNELSLFNSIKIFPNPVNQNLFIISEYPLQEANIRILDIYGQIVSESDHVSTNQLIIDMSAVTSGNYFVEITDRNNKYIKKILKE